MNLMMKNQFSLNRGASKKQFPITTKELRQRIQDSHNAHPALSRLRNRLASLDSDMEEGGGGGDYSRSCFPAGTHILLGDNTSKPIEEVVVGDVVMGFDGQRHVPAAVEAVEMPLRDHSCVLTFDDGSTLTLTREHPLCTSEGWRSLCPASMAEENASLLVGTLNIGDHVLTASGSYRTLIAVRTVIARVETYNLSKLSGVRSYFANGCIAHNKAHLITLRDTEAPHWALVAPQRAASIGY